MKLSSLLSVLLTLTISCSTETAASDTSDASSVVDTEDTTTQETPDVSVPPKELTFTDVPHAAGVDDPICEVRCPGFWKKRGLWYLDGVKAATHEMRATCSITPDNKQCCMQLEGALTDANSSEEITFETSEGKLPTEVTDPMNDLELYDKGDPNIMLLNVWAYGEINGTYTYFRE